MGDRIGRGWLCASICALVSAAPLGAQQVLVEARSGLAPAVRTLPEGAVAVAVSDTQGGAAAVRIFGAADAPEPVVIKLTAPPLVSAAAAVTPPGARALAPVPGAARAAVRAQQARVEAALTALIGQGNARSARTARAIRHRYEDLFNGFAVDLTRAERDAIARTPDVAEVYPDAAVEAVLDTSVPLVGAPAFWSAYSLSGAGTTIAIVDTGVYYPHPDLGGCFGPGCKVIGGRDVHNGDDDPIDDNGHGTHVAATAAGNGALLGVAPEARILAYKVLGTSGSGSMSDVMRGIEHAVSDGADVINLSLGAAGDPDDPLAQMVDNAVEAGVVVVAAAGNDGRGLARIGSPGAARRAITVGATDALDAAARFSSTGPAPMTLEVKPDLAAPGVSICAADTDPSLHGSVSLGPDCLDADHMQISGTSMATPHVAGAAALLVELYPDSTPDEIKSLLVNNAADVGLPVLTAGGGRLDIPAAAEALTTLSPAVLSFGRQDMSQTVWTAARSFTVRNEDAVSRSYTLATSTLPAGVTAQVTPAAFTLAPGASRAVTLDLQVDNGVLAPNAVPPYAYDGVVLVQSGAQTQRLPFAFLTLAKLTLRFDREADIALVHDRNGFASSTVVSGRTITLPALRGTYDVVWQSAYQPGAPSTANFFVREGVLVQGDTEVSLTTPRDPHLVTFRPTDAHGEPLISNVWRTARLWHAGGRAGIVAMGAVGNTPKFLRVLTGDIPSSYSLDLSVFEFRSGGREEYFASTSLIDGIDGDVTLGNAGPLMHADVRYYPRPGQQQADVRLHSFNWELLDGGGLSNGAAGPPAEGLRRRLYLAPALYSGAASTLRIEVYPQPYDGFGFRRPSPAYSVQAETLGLRGGVAPGTIEGFNDFEVRRPAAVYQSGDEIPIGLGPNFWRLRTDNGEHRFAIDQPSGSDPGGLYGFASQSAGRVVDFALHSVAWELRAGATPVAGGFLPQLYSKDYWRQFAPSLPMPPDVYTLAAVGPTHWLRGATGSTAFEATFDTRLPGGPQPYDPNPPWMSSLKILLDGVPSDHAYADRPYTVEAVIRDDTAAAAGGGLAAVALTVAAPGGDVVIPATPLGDHRWAMLVGTCAPGPVDLTLTATDAAGNQMRQVFTPGLICVPATCGDGALDAGESCDDGNRQPFDCCSELCDYEPAGTVCGDDGNQCTLDRCDAAGVCAHSTAAAELQYCDDGDPCTNSERCYSGVCTNGGTHGTTDERISARLRPGAANDRMTLRATLDQGMIGNRPTESGLEIRLLDASGTPLYAAVTPASHWSDRGGKGRRYLFVDRGREVAAANGVTTAKITRKSTGAWAVKVKITGATLDALAGHSSVGLQVRLGAGHGADCVADADLDCDATAASVSCRE